MLEVFRLMRQMYEWLLLREAERLSLNAGQPRQRAGLR
jgi:hypothetical protein